MGLIDRNTSKSHLYGGSNYASPTVSVTGDVEITIIETVLAGATLVTDNTFTIAEMVAMNAHVTNADAIVTDGTSTFLAAGTYERLWTSVSGEANPLTGPTAPGITIDNSGGATDVTATIHILVENP